METRTVVRAVATLRAAWGAALTFETEPLLRVMVRDGDATGSLLLFARTVGIRDLVFGLGALVSTMDERRSTDTRRWISAWLASDIGDAIAAATARRRVGPLGAFAAAAAPIPFIAAGLWMSFRLSRFHAGPSSA